MRGWCLFKTLVRADTLRSEKC